MKNALTHELSCRYLQPILDLCDAEMLAPLCADWGVRVEQLRDQTNWVSLRFCEALVELAGARVGADQLTEKVTRAALSPRAMGFLYPLLRAFGSPRLGFPTLPKLVAQLNKVSVVEVRDVRRGSCQIEYRPSSSEYQERSPLICRVRKAQLAASPTLWSLPPAHIDEKECQAQGGVRCLYDLRWAERTGFWGLLLGAGAGVAASLFFTVAVWPVLAGAALGALWDQRRKIAEHRRFNDEQTAALRDAADAAERRFVELERAKSEVERQVEERTAELREASQKLQTSLERLEQLGRVKDEFLANVSHELRTPLTLIMAPLEELLAGRTSSSHEYLSAMHRSAVHLNGMVNDLLMLARLQAGQLRLSVEETDVGALVQAAAEQFRALAEKKGIRIQVERDQGCLVWLDAGRVEFVLVNLLSNAFKFTLPGGVVTLRVKKGVFVEVEDTGVGIAEELQPHLFERFNRYENPAVAGAAGAGIGLALVKELVELHGGTVQVQSAPGRGSRFVLAFRAGREHLGAGLLERRQSDVAVPFGRRSADLELESDAGFAPDRGEMTHPPAAPADAPRILVVEDNPDMRRFIGRVLGDRYRVTEVDDGEKALAAVAAEPPDLVLSDVMMPRLNGYQLCRRLKDDLATRLIPVLLLTAKKERSIEGFEAGADDYLVKPFNAQELIARIDVHLRLRRLLRDRVHVEKLATLGSLAAGLAHEVRNPAGAILAGLPKVRRSLADKVEPRALEMIDVAIESATRIAALVDDLLSLGQPDHEGVRLWDPHEGIEAAIRILGQRRARSVPMKVEIRRAFTFHGKLRCRPDALNQVFLNLIDNALHAVEDGGIVEVQTREEDGGVAVLVADSGKGVPREVRSRIFEPFFSTRAPGNGTGLGLHISQRVAVDHGGRLELVNAEGWGACFRLWLPQERP